MGRRRMSKGRGVRTWQNKRRSVVAPALLFVVLVALAALAVVLSVSGLFSLLGGRAQAGRSSPKQPVATAGGKGRVLVVSIAEEEGSPDEPEQVAAPRQLRPGEVLRTTGEIDAVLEFPDAGGARVDVAPGADVEGLPAGRSDRSEQEGALGLYLRVGRVTVTAVAKEFTVRTPVVHVVGGAGSVFTVRVVLDAATEVHARRGIVDVWSTQGRRVARLSPGKGGRFDGSGGVELSP
jgi:hypothetical protein